MDEELTILITQLKNTETKLEKLKSCFSTMTSQQLSDLSQTMAEELSAYRKQIEKLMTHSRSPQAREMAKAQMLYFQSMEIILKDNPLPEEEISLLYHEFTLNFMHQSVLHTLYYLIKTNSKVKEKINAPI